MRVHKKEKRANFLQRPRENNKFDILSAAGVDLQEEEAAIIRTLGPAGVPVKNPFRGSAEPELCSSKALKAIAKRVSKLRPLTWHRVFRARALTRVCSSSAGRSVTFSPDVEQLLSLAIERRMDQLLERLANAARAAQDAPRTSAELGPIRITSDPAAALKVASDQEEASQARKAKRERDEVNALLESNQVDDVRVKQLMDEQARQRSAAATSEAALQFAKSGYVRACVRDWGVLTRQNSSRRPLAVEDPPEVRIGRTKVSEGFMAGEGSRVVEDYDRRMGAIARGQERLQRGAASERHIGLRELLFVLDADPFFKNQRLLATLKSGFVGRGVVGEPKFLYTNK